jgi:1,2-phenylacetyl-CoA epoxidase PaaB subunit
MVRFDPASGLCQAVLVKKRRDNDDVFLDALSHLNAKAVLT